MAEATRGIDNVDTSASVSMGGKRKREHDSEPQFDTDASRRRVEEGNDGTNVSQNKYTNATTIAAADYTVGWVCALPLEMAAAKGMLDKVHPNLPEQDVADHNSYVLGQVQGHNVVIACLPAGIYGTTPAATVAKDVLRTFKSIRFGLMVGIGGGAPSQKQTPDIRLGDIVVSQPSGTSGGVIQYDRGKTVKDGEFQRTGSLNAPPQVLLAALNRLQADHMIEDSKIPQFLRELVSKSPKRMKKKFVHQGAANDHLFNAGYDHVSPDATCKQCCDLSQTVKRDDRDDTDPVIHYGNIASGNQVVKDAKTRDRLSKELGALCFEMEAAGLQDFPCLVIRGICDYADSHKNKSWQEYAAATAAAFAKELLSVIPPTRVLQEKPIPHIVSDPRLHELVSNTNTAISVQTQKQEVRYKDQKQVDCHLAFKTSTYEKFKNINPERVPGTCKWVLDHPRYTHWRESRHDDLLWISADPGCGKSVLAKFLIDEELQHTTEHTVCHFFFKDNTEQNSLSTALCALLHQLFQNQILLLRHAMPAFERNGQSIRTEVDELWRIFLAAAMDDQAVNITCVIDALDECCVEDRRKLIRYLTNFHKRRTTSTRNFQLKFLVTSRPYQDVESEFRDIPEPQSIRLAGEDSNASISEEINLVIQDKVATAGRKLGMSQDLQNALQEKLSSVPHRTYLWLHLVIDEVYHNPKRHKNTFIKELKSLPTTVEDAYEKILGRINHNRRQEAQTLLHIIVAAHRPLTVSEMDVAFQLATDAADAQVHEDLDLNHDNLMSHIRELCGLFVFVNDNRIYLIHQTAKEFLVTRESLDFPASNLWKHSLHEARSNAVMEEICVRYLSFEDIRDQDITNFGLFFDVVDSAAYPFLDYSASYWPAHSQRAMSTNLDLQDRVMKLYDKHTKRFSTWRSIFWKTRFPGTWSNGSDFDNAHLAALNGHHEVLHRLLVMGQAARDSRDNEGRTPLIWGCLEGHEQVVQILLDSGADVNADYDASSDDYRTKFGRLDGNALWIAASRGFDKIARILLDNGANIGASGKWNQSALEVASFRGDHIIVQMLVDEGADVNAQDCSYWASALQAASYGGYNKVVEILLSKGADVNKQDGPYGDALQAASVKGHDKIAKILIDEGANPNAQGGIYGNALLAASVFGHSKVVRMLLDKGVDVNTQFPEFNHIPLARCMDREVVRTPDGSYRNVNSYTYGNALQAASSNGHYEIVGVLLKSGADVNAQGGTYGNALQAASSNGHYEIVGVLLESGADVNAQGGTYRNALQAASSNGYYEIVGVLLESGADVNAQGGTYGNALQAASSNGHCEIVQLLLEGGADANAGDSIHMCALYEASIRGYNKIVQLLLNHSADNNIAKNTLSAAVKTASFYGYTKTVHLLLEAGADLDLDNRSDALYQASSQGYNKIVQLLLDCGADANATRGRGRNDNALSVAIAGGHRKTVQVLLEGGADPNEGGNAYSKPLYQVSSQGDDKMVQLLLDHGADVNPNGGRGNSCALGGASWKGHDRIVQILLDHGADVNVGDSIHSALEIAVCTGHERIIQILLNHGADVNGTYNIYGTALQHASAFGRNNIVRILLDCGVEVNVTGGWYGTALQAASAHGCAISTQILLDHGADVNIQGGEYGNALGAASVKGYDKIVQMLLDHGADVNRTCSTYGTALKNASAHGYHKVVKILLDHGAEVNITGGWHGSALQAASAYGHTTIVQILLDHGADVNIQGGEYGNALGAASAKRHDKIIQMLLDHGADASYKKASGA